MVNCPTASLDSRFNTCDLASVATHFERLLALSGLVSVSTTKGVDEELDDMFNLRNANAGQDESKKEFF